MTPQILRTVACAFAGLVTSAAALSGGTLPAHAASGLESVIASFGITDYRLTVVQGSGDITNPLQYAIADPGTAQKAHVVRLPAGSYTLRSSIRMAGYVYLIADDDASITLTAPAAQMLQFTSLPAAGVSGGSWSAGSKGTANVFGLTGSSAVFKNLSITKAGKHGIAAYAKSAVAVRDVDITASERDGIHVRASVLSATRLHSTHNRNNGVQLSEGSTGTISDSQISFNGQAVTGSTTGKTGHGLGVANSWATVLNSDLSNNKVCGISTTGPSGLTVRNSTLNRNGRHGLGTTAGGVISFTDTTVVGNHYNGVLITGSGTRATLTRVKIADSDAYGISLPGRGSVVLTDTVVSGSGKTNVAASQKSVITLVSGNTITGAGAHGIALASKSRLTVSGSSNVISDNRTNGLMLSDRSTSGTIRASVSFVGNHQVGVVVRKKASLQMVHCEFVANPTATATRSGGKTKKL